MLVMIAVAMAVVLSLSFTKGQVTSAGISDNALYHTRARTIAESALTIGIDHVRAHPDWRDNLPSGVWVNNQSFDGGRFTLTGHHDGDSDVLLTAIGTFDGVTHRVAAQLVAQPAPGAAVCLFILQSGDAPDDMETAYIQLIESWGYHVLTIDDDASQSAFDAAVARASVVYIRKDVKPQVADKITDRAIGIVTEHGGTYAALGFSASDGTYSGSAIDVVNPDHPLTAQFGAGEVTLCDAAVPLKTLDGPRGEGVITLAERIGSSQVAFAALHVGAARYGGGDAPGRRVMLPWGDDEFALPSLANDGLTLMRRAMDWAATGVPQQPAAALTPWQGGLFNDIADGDDRLLIFVATTEGDHTITSVTFGGQPMIHVADDGIYTPTMWGKAFMYRLGESGIAAAVGDRFEVDYTGGASSWKFASRLYQHVNQANPIRAHSGETQGDTPNTITSGALDARPGDIAVALVHCGEDTSYTWQRAFVEGIDFSGNSFTLSAADRQLVDPSGPIQSQATAGRANRQVLITAALASAPGGGDVDGEGAPQLLGLWEFDEIPIPDPNRLGRWRLDDAVGGAGVLGIGAEQEVLVLSGSLIDSYDSTLGPYGDDNRGDQAYVGTNYDYGTRIIVSASEVRGHAYCGIGGDPDRIIATPFGGKITGVREALIEPMPIRPLVPVPDNMPASEGSARIRSNTTWSSDHVFRDLIIENCTITIDGHVRIYATRKIEIKNAAVHIPPGSSLSIYGDQDIIMHRDSEVNFDTQAAGRLHIYMRDDEEELIIKDRAKVCGILYSRNDIEIRDNGELWGAVEAYDDIELWNRGKIHMDAVHGGAAAGSVATETVVGNSGEYHNSPTGNAAGPQGAAVRFDGVDDHLTIAHHDSYRVADGSIAFWFNPDDADKTQSLLTKGDELVIALEGGRVVYRLHGQTLYSDAVAEGQWHHVVATFGLRGMELFVSGVSVDDNNQRIGLAENDDLIAVGASPFFDGLLDDLQLFDQALDVGQIANVMTGGDPGPSNLPGPVIADTSGFGDPLDLVIDNLDHIAWTDGGGLTFTGPADALSPGAAVKLYNALTVTSEVTLEVIFTPAGVDNGRVVTYSNGAGQTNFSFDQSGEGSATRLRTSDTFSDGSPEIESTGAMDAELRQHVIVTYNGDNVRLFRSGFLELTEPRTGTFTWDPAMHFAMGSETDGNAAWRGTLHRVAIYDRAVDTLQATNLFKGAPPGPPSGSGSSGTTYAVRWLETQ